jgi:hypothetical protein
MMASKNNKVIPYASHSRARLILTLPDTLIVWTEPTTNIDMALSFEASEGCASVWLVKSCLRPCTTRD